MIDERLVHEIKEGRVILFLGAGASFGAKNEAGGSIPLGQTFGQEIAEKFLPPEYSEDSFSHIYDLACSSRSGRDVQEFIHKRLKYFQPANYHGLIPKFAWAGIATTNYDLIIERSYKGASKGLIVFSRDQEGIDAEKGKHDTIYLKLHGCIKDYQNVSPPLIASTEQIINSHIGRQNQFKTFLEWAKSKTIVFVGYSFRDANLRTLVDAIVKEGDNRPRHYIVDPEIRSLEMEYWRDRRFNTLKMSFQDFLEELNVTISDNQATLSQFAASQRNSSFSRFISVANAHETSELVSYIENSLEHVVPELSDFTCDPKSFYAGFDLGWAPIEAELDISRKVVGEIIQDQVITYTSNQLSKLVILKSHAGSGKSICLRRIAWNVGKTLNKIVFFLPRTAHLSVEHFREMFNLTNKPIILVVDDLMRIEEQVRHVSIAARKENWPLLIIGGVRNNEYNINGEYLAEFAAHEYELGNLSPSEIKSLLKKLDEHGCLGVLKELDEAQRFDEFQKIYNRQMLVALHEATRGKPLRDIVRDEYDNIYPPEAQQLYLDICALHRHDLPVRAGLISRLHDIGFKEFESRFLGPLEKIVHIRMDGQSGDYIYQARHSYIAQIVYENAYEDQNETYDSITRMLNKLNPSFSYDLLIARHLLNNSTLSEVMSSPNLVRQVYHYAIQCFGELAPILQQWGIFEMKNISTFDDADHAEKLFRKAQHLSPKNKAIKHSLAELDLRRSQISLTPIEASSWRKRAVNQARVLARRTRSSHPYSTLVKAFLADMRDAIEKVEQDGDDVSVKVLNDSTKEAEKYLREGLEAFSNEPHLMTLQADFFSILSQADKALNALRKAFDNNPRSLLAAIRLSDVLFSKAKYEEAEKVLTDCLEYHTANRDLHYRLALTFIKRAPNSHEVYGETILFHLKRATSLGDKNHNRQFWLARQFWLLGEFDNAERIFNELKDTRSSYTRKSQERGKVLSESGDAVIFYGVVKMTSSSWGYLTIESKEVDAHFTIADGQHLKKGDRVSFNLAFNFFGPVAKNLQSMFELAVA